MQSKEIFTFENLESSSESQLWNMPVFLISRLPPWKVHRSERLEDRPAHSSHEVLLRGREGLLLQPYGVLKFWGTNQNGNLKSYLGNKTCVTRNRPTPKYILVYGLSYVNHMSLGRILGGQQRAGIFSTERMCLPVLELIILFSSLTVSSLFYPHDKSVLI